MNDILWTPTQDQIRQSRMTRFMEHVTDRTGVEFADYFALHRWSVEQIEPFWSHVWDFCQLTEARKGDRILVDADRMPGARFFPDGRLNFAQNLLVRTDEADALVFRGEERIRRSLSWRELNAQVSGVAHALQGAGIQPGDRVAALTPNCIEAVTALLGATALGAVWSSCSPDFGVRGIVDRFGQIGPRVLFVSDGYEYNGKWFDNLPKIREVVAEIPEVEHIVVWPLDGETPPDLSALAGCTAQVTTLADWSGGPSRAPIPFAGLPFDHPLYIMFSSGTTGVPKCIVHSSGGTLLQHLKEHRLHCDLTESDRFFYFTTCGWMMWNWLVSGLASGATLLLYDGSPFCREGRILYDLAQEEQMTVLGTSAKWIDSCARAGLEPHRTHDLGRLRLITSTGSPLSAEGFDYVYRNIRPDIPLASISGGTDILACFIGGCPILPVRRGEIQAPGLGMAVSVFDANGGEAPDGARGELVCTRPFPSMPLGFWNDDAQQSRYRRAYFEAFPDVWTHGDFIERTPAGGYVVHGRSDTVLNPGGVRIGTAEIYRQVEQLAEIEESIVIGQAWEDDVRVVLFVKLRPGHALDDGLRERIRAQIRRNTTPRHVPARVLAVPDIPRTRSGKIVEIAVRNVVQGEAVPNLEALANPEALEHFRKRPELAE